jgi:hypothetical protein
MKFAGYNSSGDILNIGHCPDGEEHTQIEVGAYLYLGEATFNDRINPVTGELIPNGKPPQPTPDHDWDNTAKVWVVNMDRARATKCKEIERLRDTRIFAPIVYDGANVDADARSQGNISVKLSGIALREGIGQETASYTWVWRDADNVDHMFASQAAYKAWLVGLALLIEDRGLGVYVWSWGKKAEVQAATTLEELEAIDLL